VLGDEVLKITAQIFKEHTRGGDIVARFGGEEFVLLLPETRLDQAHTVAEKIRHKVETHCWQSLHPDLNVTISLGIADSQAHPSKALLSDADEQLYRAKKNSKNQVRP
jgi:diguanylate cyclase (GGDEF)-like protein